jgi:hypothetical protein
MSHLEQAKKSFMHRAKESGFCSLMLRGTAGPPPG